MIRSNAPGRARHSYTTCPLRRPGVKRGLHRARRVQQAALRPQVHQPFRGRGARQPQHPLHRAPMPRVFGRVRAVLAAAFEDAEPVGGRVLVPGQFIQYDPVPWPLGHFPVQPPQVLLVDDRHRRLLGQCFTALLGVGFHPACDRPVQCVRLAPFGQFRRPGVDRHGFGRDDQETPVGVEAVHDVQNGDGRQCLAQPHVQKQAGAPVRLERVEGEQDGLFLVCVQFHHARL